MCTKDSQSWANIQSSASMEARRVKSFQLSRDGMSQRPSFSKKDPDGAGRTTALRYVRIYNNLGFIAYPWKQRRTKIIHRHLRAVMSP